MLTVRNISFSGKPCTPIKPTQIYDACERLGAKIGNELVPRVRIRPGITLLARRVSAEEDMSTLVLNIKRNKGEASVNLLKENMVKIRVALLDNTRKTSKMIENTIEKLKRSLNKASKDEAKSLTDF